MEIKENCLLELTNNYCDYNTSTNIADIWGLCKSYDPGRRGVKSEIYTYIRVGWQTNKQTNQQLMHSTPGTGFCHFVSLTTRDRDTAG